MTHPGWTSWSLDPAFLGAIALAAWAYSHAYRRAGRLAAKPPGPSHWMPFAAGLIVLAITLTSPLEEIGARYLISAHMVQHVLLADLAPALLVLGLRAPMLPLGLPSTGLRWIAPGGTLGRFIHVATRPWVALPVWAIATWVWAIPAVFDAASGNPLLHALEHATLFYAGVAVWWLIIDPLPSARRKPHRIRLGYLAFTRLVSVAVCLPLVWLGTTFYPRYADAPRAYGLSAIQDQRIAGAAMCLLEFVIFGIALAVVFLDLRRRDERLAGRSQPLFPNDTENDMKPKIALTALSLSAALLLPATVAQAHVSVVPRTAAAGSFSVFDVRVPNEREDAATVKVDLKLPDGFITASFEPIPGWRARLIREQLSTPIETENGPIAEQVSRVVWSSDGSPQGRIPPGAFQDFPLSVKLPDDAGATLTFKALQTYEGGEIVRWIGSPDSELPAAQVQLTAAEGEGEGAGAGHSGDEEAPADESGAAGTAATAAQVDSTGSSEGASKGLAFAGLGVGIVGLLLGAAALMVASRSARPVGRRQPK